MTGPGAVQVSMVVSPGTWRNMSAVAQTVDEVGLHGVAVADTPMVERDVYLSCAAAALSTSRCKIVTGVTNPVTRHPSIAAASFRQLEELAPGRIVCGIATGDSAVWGVGLEPAKVGELKEYILAIKALLKEEPATWRGKRFCQGWREFEPFDLPVYVACAGPKSIHMASQVADGLILSVGVSADDLRWADERISAACAEIGRDPTEVDVWHYAEITFGGSAEEAAENSLGWFSHFAIFGGTAGKRVPEDLIPALTALNADSQDLEAAYASEGRGRVLVERAKALGVYDWIISRSPCLWGTPRDVRARLETLRTRGADKWMLFPDGMQIEDTEVAQLLGETRRANGVA